MTASGSPLASPLPREGHPVSQDLCVMVGLILQLLPPGTAEASSLSFDFLIRKKSLAPQEILQGIKFSTADGSAGKVLSLNLKNPHLKYQI